MARGQIRSHQCLEGSRCLGSKDSHLCFRPKNPPILQSCPSCQIQSLRSPSYQILSQDEIATRYPRPFLSESLAPPAKPVQYPTTYAAEAMDVTLEVEGERGKRVQSKKRKLVARVGRRGQEIGRA